MPERFRPFPPLSCAYGAPMGRASTPVDPDLSLEDLAAAGPAGEYDAGGSYWGHSPLEGPVWAVWQRGRGRDGVQYIRAKSRESAKRKALGHA